ncbi:MAG: glycosyltransferase [Saprospiraceae bacterium]|nr:glycosyltransferase [Saprospiraceae bacterium]
MITRQKSIYFAVTNDLNQDQRMHRICASFNKFGYKVILVGRANKKSSPLFQFPFTQKRLDCWFQKGVLFYAEYNIRLFFFLLLKQTDIIYSVDLDTIPAAGLIKLLKRNTLLFDAHEYFSETPELIHRKNIKKCWKIIGDMFVPMADHFITVNESLAELLGTHYGKKFVCIYNVPSNLIDGSLPYKAEKPYILYQGMLNEGRGIAELIDAMDLIKGLDLYIIGEGDLSKNLRTRSTKGPSASKIHFLGWQSPDEMKKYTLGATLGINLLENTSLSYYYSLANKFFDYMHAGVPSVNMDFPEYHKIIEQYPIGILISGLDKNNIAMHINQMMSDPATLNAMKQHCLTAKTFYNWEKEEIKLFELLNENKVTH